MSQRCKVIGVLDSGMEGLTQLQQQMVAEAEVVIGGGRLLALLSDAFRQDVEQLDLTGSFVKVPEWVEDALEESKSVVVLATGDPLCHGVGEYLISKLGADRCEVIPATSTLQWACARLGKAWQGVRIQSVHGRDAGEWVAESGPEHGLYQLLQELRHHDFLAVFTSPENGPDRIARMMVMEGLDQGWQMAVAENLLQKGEHLVGPLPVAEGAGLTFSKLNLLLLWCEERVEESQPRFGIADNDYLQRKPERGLITKREVRAVSLARMQLCLNSIVWDIGAGSGSVGLEAARVASRGHVYAIEKNEADAENVRANRKQLQVTNHTLVVNRAPSGMEEWPAPSAVFIGGSGGALGPLIHQVLQRMEPGGWLVMNFVTLENLAEATGQLKQEEVEWDVTQLQASRSAPILNMNRMQAENPVWVVSARKQATR